MAHVFSERNIAPARSKWAKYCIFRRAGAKNISPHPTAPHAGAVFLSPQSHSAPRRDKTRPTRPHQRPSGKKFAQHRQNCPKSALFRLQGEFFLGLTQNPLLLGEFFTPMGATATSQHLPTTSPETDNTNAGGSLPRDETTDTFARTKQPNSGHFPPAKVSRVSCAPCRAPAKALPVSPTPDATPTAQTSRGVRTRHYAGGTLAT